jgi:hypothetical protein
MSLLAGYHLTTNSLTPKLLLALASTVVLGSEFHILLSDGSGSLQTTLPLIAMLLLTLASTMNICSESHGTHDHILLSVGCRSLQTTLPWPLS